MSTANSYGPAREIRMKRTCMKCLNPASIVIRVNDAFCKTCFISYCTHKFRSAFGKSKVVRDEDKVLLAFSGGNGCTAMLHLTLEGKSSRAQKKLRFLPGLVFIDESATLGEGEKLEESREKIVRTMQSTGLPCYVTRIEQALNCQPDVRQGEEPQPPGGDPRNQSGALYEDVNGEVDISRLQLDDALRDKFRQMLENTKTLTAKQSLLENLRRNLLISVARQAGYKFIMTGESCTQLSVRLLANIAQGCGAHIPLNTGFADNRYGDVTIIRPLRGFTSKEVAMYNVFHNLEPVCEANIATKTSQSSSIQRLTEGFVAGLQADFPSTVSTIFRTSEKLCVDGSTDVETCVLCQGALDTCVPISSALNSTTFSASLSQKPRPLVASDCGTSTEGCCGEGDGSCQSSGNKRLSTEKIEESLCYGCRLITRHMINVSSELPAPLLEHIEWRSRRSKMKEEISQFLLTDTD